MAAPWSENHDPRSTFSNDHAFAAAWRPVDLARLADKLLRVAFPGKRPGKNDLAALLPNGTEFQLETICGETGFFVLCGEAGPFVEFPLRCRQSFFAAAEFAFRQRPSVRVFLDQNGLPGCLAHGTEWKSAYLTGYSRRVTLII